MHVLIVPSGYQILKQMVLFSGLHLRSCEESRMPAEGLGAESGLHRLHRHCYDPEYARMEAWLDEHPDFVQDYFLR